MAGRPSALRRWPPTWARAPAGEQSERDTHFHASNERYVRKHYGPTGWWVFRTGVMAGALVRALFLPGDRGRRGGHPLPALPDGSVRRPRPALAGPRADPD